MSWGERSCKQPCRAPKMCEPATCNVDCPGYLWDGCTEPDSKHHEPDPPQIMRIFRPKKVIDAKTQEAKETKFWRRMMIDLGSLHQEIDRVIFGKLPMPENKEITVTLPAGVDTKNLNVGSIYEVGNFEINKSNITGRRKLLKMTPNPDGTTTLLLGKPKG